MDRACRYSQHAPSKADSSGKAWKRSREIIELQQFHRKNAVLGVPGTAFCSVSLSGHHGSGAAALFTTRPRSFFS